MALLHIKLIESLLIKLINPLQFSFFLLLLLIKLLQPPFHFQYSWYLNWSNSFKYLFHCLCCWDLQWSNLISFSRFLVLLPIKPIQIPFPFHCSWYFYRSNRLKFPFSFIIFWTFTKKIFKLHFIFRVFSLQLY